MSANKSVNDANDADDSIDYREHPERYRIGRGEEGVMNVEPYKSELLPHWRFKNPDLARESAEKIWEMFCDYLAEDDFVGADMARKYLQMGWTRARRYAKHKSGRKYDPDSGEELPEDQDPEKAKAAEIFYEKYQRAKADETYQRLKEQHRARYRDT